MAYQLEDLNNIDQVFISHLLETLSGSTVLSESEILRRKQSYLYLLSKGEAQVDCKNQYETGKKEVIEKTKAINIYYQQVLSNSNFYGNLAMEETLNSFHNFFDEYLASMDYYAHELPGVMIDYQLNQPVDDNRYRGIDFVEEYLKRFELEQKLMAKFSTNIVRKLLTSYSEEILGYSYTLDVNNLYEVVMRHYVLKMMNTTNEPIMSLSISVNDWHSYLYLRNDSEKINHLVERQLNNNNYWLHTAKNILERLSYLEANDLVYSHFFVMDKAKKNQIRLSLEAMDTAEFTQLIEETQEDSSKLYDFLSKNDMSPIDIAELIHLNNEDTELIKHLNLVSFTLFEIYLNETIFLSEEEAQWLELIVEQKKYFRPQELNLYDSIKSNITLE